MKELDIVEMWFWERQLSEWKYMERIDLLKNALSWKVSLV